jgi:crotonobetainyl-CoA:carnitine CoA-transferase CaiB-like acyl-CoA transferase
MPSMTNVMEGIRILEVAEHTFVPAASAILADWGAEVIKIEHVERGDAMRGLMSSGIAGFGGAVHVLMENANRGKKSLALDLSDAAGVEILYRLAEQCDVFLTNKMPGVRTRLHIDVDDIRAHNPNIVYVRGTGYGSHGPDADAGGYDFLGYWARGCSADAATPPNIEGLITQPAPAYGDNIGAMTIAGGICAALLHRERTGEAPVVDVSLLGTGMWAMSGAIASSLVSGAKWTAPPSTGHPSPSNPLVGTYRTSDGRYLAFSMLQGFQYWPEVCRRVGRDDLIDDPRFDSVENLMKNTPEAAAILDDEIGARPLAEWKERLTGMKGQWAVVQNTLEVADDPQVDANTYIQELTTDEGTQFRLVTTPVQFDDEAAPIHRSPTFNEHGDAILQEMLGLDWDTIVDLKVKGVVA